MTSSNGRANKVFFILCIMGGFAIFSSTMSKYQLNPFATSLGTPADWTGLVGAASTIPGILISLPAASLSDILGRRKFLFVAAFVFASAPFLYLFITVWWQLVLVRFYHGFATAIFVPVAEASAAEMFPEKRGERISLFSSATYVGRVIAPFLGGYILFATADNYHTLYLAVGVAGVTAFMTALFFLWERRPQTPTQATRNEGTVTDLLKGWRTVMRNRNVVLVCFMQASLFYTYGAVEYYLSGYLRNTLGFDSLLTGIVTGGLAALAIVVRPYMGRHSDLTGRRTPIMIGLLVCSFPLLAIPFTDSFPILLLLSLVYGFGFATVTASTPALISELLPKERAGMAMGFMDMTMDIGQTLGPIISGFILATSLSYKGLFPSLSVLLLVSCGIFALFLSRQRR
jgi:MFS family permease